MRIQTVLRNEQGIALVMALIVMVIPGGAHWSPHDARDQ
jgi:hypothetical protein